ncbi:hypothetical protein EJ06DRAFT_463316, partial [Trichodelitschia bisporula]
SLDLHPFSLPDAASRSDSKPMDADTDSKRMSLSSLYSLGSAIYHNARGIAGSGNESVAGSEADGNAFVAPTLIADSNSLVPDSQSQPGGVNTAASSQHGSQVPREKLHAEPGNVPHQQAAAPTSVPQVLSNSPTPSIHWSSLDPTRPPPSNAVARSRSRTRTQRRLSAGTSTNSVSPGSERSNRDSSRRAPYGVIGVCALDTKARSRPSRNILNKLIAKGEFEVNIFGDKIILDEEVENWPICDYLISFFSDGFPLEKAIAYVKLRKPFCVNDLFMQMVLWDRRLCLMILDKQNVPTPRRLMVNRDGGPKLHSEDVAQLLADQTGVRLPGSEDGTGGGMPPPKSIELIEDDEVLVVDGKQLRKPFVEKPVSGEDHNIRIYYSKAQGGGGRRLFRKVNNKSSERDDTLCVPRCVTDPTSSYIYEQFLRVENAEDVKAYTVGPDFCHAETRKSPVVDGIVKRNPNGKEVRYVANLTQDEAEIARRIVNAFGQRVCGFDLLRANGRSYVIDVNGWSFVKDNNEYYDACAHILRELFLSEKQRRDGTAPPPASFLDPDENDKTRLRKNPAGHRSTLKSLFQSPSMSKLTGHHHHLHTRGPASPDLQPAGVPLTSPPSLERSTHPVSTLPMAPETQPSKARSMMSTDEPSPVPQPASKAQWRLKGMVSVIRHADRTPKQKFKFTFHTKPFVDLLKGHQEEVLLIGEPALASVLEAVETAFAEGIEDVEKLKLLRTSLVKKGSWAGTKVQIKPMFRKRKEDELEGAPALHRPHLADSEHHDSTSDVTLSRISAAEKNLVLDKLQLIIKWGGEPTHSALYQSQDLGESVRNDLLLLNRECLEDVKIFSSSERRVVTSAQIFAGAFLAQKDLPPDLITVRKALLDDSNAAKDEMDKVKKKLKQLLREGDAAPAQFAWPPNTPEPASVVRKVVELMKFHRRVMRHNFAKLEAGATNGHTHGSSTGLSTPTLGTIQARWCCGEDGSLFRERWEKLFKEFCDAEKVDPSKISELYDSMKFDALHNRQFLEWAFTPDASDLDGEAVSEPSTPGAMSARPSMDLAAIVLPDRAPTTGGERSGSLAKRMGLRGSDARRTEPQPESYFNLYTGLGQAGAKAKLDVRLARLRELYQLCKVLFDYIGPQEYGISGDEKLEIGLLTSLPLLREIVKDIEEVQASEGAKSFFYFTKESHIYTLLNCILEGGVRTKIERRNIPELDYLSQINFELYESQNATVADEPESFNYSIRISISPGCHAFDPLDVQLDSRHYIGCAPRRSLTAHQDWKQILESLREKFTKVKLPKSFIPVDLSEK